MIILDDKYCIDANDSCYSLKVKTERRTKRGTPKPDEDGNAVYVYRAIGYYTKPNQALLAWYNELNREAVKSRSMGLQQALTLISENAEKVSRAIRDAIPELKEQNNGTEG